MPQKRRSRAGRELTFSPSRADACLRELYYDANDAPADEGAVIAWKERRRRNGDAYHRETQRKHAKMADALREAGLPVYFEILAIEVDGFAQFDVTLDGKSYRVRLKGRADYIVRYVGERIPGVIEPGDLLVVDLKSKDKLSGVNGVQRKGIPSYTHAQIASYSLLRFPLDGQRTASDIDKAIIHYESLQKPKENETETKDLYVVDINVTEDDQRRILVRLAKAVRYIEAGELPPPELDKCHFCDYRKVCAKDGGYAGGDGS